MKRKDKLGHLFQFLGKKQKTHISILGDKWLKIAQLNLHYCGNTSYAYIIQAHDVQIFFLHTLDTNAQAFEVNI